MKNIILLVLIFTNISFAVRLDLPNHTPSTEAEICIDNAKKLYIPTSSGEEGMREYIHRYTQKKLTDPLIKCLKKYNFKNTKNSVFVAEMTQVLYTYAKEYNDCNVIKLLLEKELLSSLDKTPLYKKGFCVLKDRVKVVHLSLKVENEFMIRLENIDANKFSYKLIKLKNFYKSMIEVYNDIGNGYLNGIGILKDCKKAIGYLKKASGIIVEEKMKSILKNFPADNIEENSKKHIHAQKTLAELYYKGVCVKKNIPLSMELYEKLSVNGDVDAQFILGKMYLEKDNYSDAKHWLQKAYLNGSQEAKKIWEDNGLSEK